MPMLTDWTQVEKYSAEVQVTAAAPERFLRTKLTATTPFLLPGWQCAQHSKGELKMESHKRLAFQKRKEKQRAGIRQGQRIELQGRVNKGIKHNFPHRRKSWRWGKYKWGGALAGSRRYPAFAAFEFLSGGSIIQLIWGNSLMLCKRLSVAMVRNPWQPTPPFPLSLQPPPPPSSL